jgi:HD-GYP domain-containing protein (c-di-GMP phosphodiesterase class II)
MIGEGEEAGALVQKLRDAGHQVSSARTVADAVVLSRNATVDTILISASQDEQFENGRTLILGQHPHARVLDLSTRGSAGSPGGMVEDGPPGYVQGGDEILHWVEGEQNAARGSEQTRESKRRVESLIKTLDLVVGLLELDDPHFAGFTSQVIKLVRPVGRELGLDEDALDELVIATLVRDLGKIGIKPQVLAGEARYNHDELEQMKEHTDWSARLLEHIDFGWNVIPIVRHHHEHYDGSGYPSGLRGRGIPLGSRIIAACEGFAAMLSDRPHRPPKSFDRAIEEIMSKAGNQFDAEIVEVLLRIVESGSSARLLGKRTPILIVDPETEFRRLLKMRLLNLGLKVRAVARIEGDPAAVLDPCPAIVLVDSGDDGLEPLKVLDGIRRANLGQHVPVAVLARYDDRLVRLNALRHGIDDYILKTNDLEEVSARVENILTRESNRRRDPAARRESGITGQLEAFAPVDIVQMMSVGLKTAKVILRSGESEGSLWFRDGNVVHAEFGPQKGEQAFYNMLAWESGTFHVKHGIETSESTIKQDAMFLLMDGMRQVDERLTPRDQPGTLEPSGRVT